jgi:hypothetical protein
MNGEGRQVMKTEPSGEFEKFRDFVRKVVSVPKKEIDKIKEQENKEKKTAPKRRPAKAKA